MGMYDTFGESHEQLKVGDCLLHHYRVGEVVDLPNGVYCGYDRAIVVNGRIFVADLPVAEIFDKWGAPIEIHVGERNPLAQVVKDEVDRLEKEGKSEDIADGHDQDASQPTKET